MRNSLRLLILFVLSLQACRSGHFEDRSTQQNESASQFSVEVAPSGPAVKRSSNQELVNSLDLILILKTTEGQPQLIRNQSLAIKVDHPSLRSGGSLIARTDDLGRIHLPLILSPNEDGPTAESFDVRIQIRTENFGTLYGLLTLDVRNPETARWQQSSQAQFEQPAPIDLRAVVSPQAHLVQSQPKEKTLRTNAIRVKFQLFRSQKSPLASTQLHVNLTSNSSNQDFTPTTDAHGNIALTLDIPYETYGPFDPFTGTFTFEVNRPEGKISTSKAVFIPRPERPDVQILNVLEGDSFSSLQPTHEFSKIAEIKAEVLSLRRAPDDISVTDDLQLQNTQTLELKLRLRLSRPIAEKSSIRKLLESVSISGQWIIANTSSDDAEGQPTIIRNEAFGVKSEDKIQTNEDGELTLSTPLRFKDLKTAGWPITIFLKIRSEDIKLLSTTFVRISETDFDNPKILSVTEANSVLGGALVHDLIPSSELPSSPPTDRPYLKNLISLSEIFAKASTFTKDRQVAVTQLQEILKTLPNSTDIEGVRNLYSLLAKVASVPTSDVSHSFRWDELIFINTTSKRSLGKGIVDEDFKTQLNRIASFDLRAITVDIAGSGSSCMQFRLWKPGTVPPNEEWVRLYWCSQETRNFSKTIEPYLLITPAAKGDGTRTPNILVRGYGDLQELRAKVINTKFSLDDTNIVELLKTYDQYSLPERRGLTIRPLYPRPK